MAFLSEVKSRIVLICGSPGSGKSTFSSSFVSNSAQKSHVVTFDELEVHKENWDAGTFKVSRAAALSKVRELLKALQPDEQLVVDDLMYLSSMRHEVFKVARDVQVPMVVIWIKTDLGTCLERNEKRTEDNKIAPETVRRIHASFEPPNKSNICDRINYTVSGEDEDNSFVDAVGAIEAQIGSLLQERRDEMIADKAKAEAAVAVADVSTSTSGASALDDRLRKVTNTLMKNAPRGECTRALLQALTEARNASVKALKQGGELGDVLASFRITVESHKHIQENADTFSEVLLLLGPALSNP
jgi:tRNA uridine 5-carbamoylmethylation protein Kti12